MEIKIIKNILFKILLWSFEEILEFIRLSPSKVIANHLEALNHCPITREQLKGELKKNNLLEKVYTPMMVTF